HEILSLCGGVRRQFVSKNPHRTLAIVFSRLHLSTTRNAEIVTTAKITVDNRRLGNLSQSVSGGVMRRLARQFRMREEPEKTEPACALHERNYLKRHSERSREISIAIRDHACEIH